MTSESLLRLLEPLRRRIALMIRRALIDLVNDDHAVQVLQLKVYRDELRQGVERLQEYGFSSVPLPGGQAVLAAVDGEAGHCLVIGTDDRRHRPRKLKPGDVMLYTSRNRVGEEDSEHHVYFEAATRTVRVRADKIRLSADDNGVEIDAGAGDVVVNGANFRWK